MTNTSLNFIKIHTRKPRQPNEEHGKVMVLIKAKQEHVASLDKIDLCDQFEIVVMKWKKISCWL
jgi:hypothetical protein